MPFSIKQNDTSPAIQATLKDADGNAVNLTGASVQFHMKDQTGTLKVDSAMTIQNATGGIVTYDWQSGDTDTVGNYSAEFEVTYSDSSVETFPNGSNVGISIRAELA